MHGALRLLGWALLTVAVVLAAAGGGSWWLYRQATGPGPLAQARTVVVPPRIGLAGIAGLLSREGVIRHRLPFEIGAELSGRGASLKAGEYRFPAGTSPLEAVGLLISGNTVKHRLTIPEGLTSPQIVALVDAAPVLSGNPGKPPAEGALLPETYIYSYGDTRKDMTRRMELAMAQALTAAWAGRRPGLPLADPEQLLILASMVER
ncbi:MAG: endolytic transglycosylase MltG, partial [Stellaceae bacterium]